MGAGIDIDDTQRFIGYLILIGVVEDYTIQGMKANMVITADLNADFAFSVETENWIAAEGQVTRCLLDYYRRYYPKKQEDLDVEIDAIRSASPGGKFLEAACHHLVDFIYNKIVYQRRNAIKDITEFCRQAKQDEARAAQIIRDYFDRSRFTAELIAMRESEPNYEKVARIMASLEENAEAEQVFWETSRLLSETERADWHLIRSSARIYLGTKKAVALDELRVGVENYGRQFLIGLAQLCSHMTNATRDHVWQDTFEKILEHVYAHEGLRADVLTVTVDSVFPPDMQLTTRNRLTTLQLRRLNDHFYKHHS